MRIIAIIPSRYASTRLAAKALALIGNKTLIQHVYEAVINTSLFDEVIIATDHQEIYNEGMKFGAKIQMTSDKHQSGSDRIAEVCQNRDFDVVVNVQGDEPFITKEPLSALLSCFANKEVNVASLMHEISEEQDIYNPNNVKVIVDKENNAIYFSRSPIPYKRNDTDNLIYYKHIGVYAYRKQALLDFVKLDQTMLEKTESLEQLRLIENGVKIRMVKSNYKAIGIDTKADLEKAREVMSGL